MVKRGSEGGQAVTEYILMVAFVAMGFIIVVKSIQQSGVPVKLLTPINQDYAHAYQYGHPKALGFDDGGPVNHPRAVVQENGNFRIFLNPHPVQ